MTDSVALTAWREFEHKFPDRARLIEIAWLYDRLIQQFNHEGTEHGPLHISFSLIDNEVPFFPDIVTYAIVGKAVREFDQDSTQFDLLYSASIEASNRNDPALLHVAIGHLILTFADKGLHAPDSLEWITVTILKEMRKSGGQS